MCNENICQERRLFGRCRTDECGGCDSAAEVERCNCCEKTISHDEVFDAVKAKIKAAEEVAAKKAQLTIRRCLVEEVKSFSETHDGKTGESDTVTVSYEYGDTRNLISEFTEVTKPTRVNVGENRTYALGSHQTYNKLELEAHIKNLQTILNSLD